MTATAVIQSLVALVTDPLLWVMMLAAIPMGMVMGAIPGLGGKLGIALSIPFVFGMAPIPGAVFLLAMHSVVHTGGAIPSILLGIPGTGPDAATVCDGHPMALRGEAGRALGAALAASAAGGVVGALFLAALVPVIQPVVFAFGPAEFFFLALLGITFIAAVSGESLVGGILVGALGLMLSFVGTDPLTATARFVPGSELFTNGIAVVPAVLGLYTIPETVALASWRMRGSSGSGSTERYKFGDLVAGMLDVWRHRMLALRASILGAVVGMIPGLGGDVAAWTAYGHSVTSSPTPERFGKGAVEGVIAPEAANNSKEGGSLLPTLLFGIPGSSGMGILLGAFVMLGIQPGPVMVRDHADLLWILMWTLVVANLLAALLFFAAGPWMIRLAGVRAGILVPFIMLLTLIGAFVGQGHWEGLLVLVALGLLGIALRRAEWPRAPFAIAIVLGPLLEISFHQSVAIWGTTFFLRPISVGLIGAIVLSLVFAGKRARRVAASTARTGASSVAVSAVLLFAFGGMVAVSLTYQPASRLVPLVIGIPATALTVAQTIRALCARSRPDVDRRSEGGAKRGERGERAASPIASWNGAAWVGMFALAVLIGGFVTGGTVAVVAAQRLWLRESWRSAALGAATAFAVTYLCFERLLGVPLFGGWMEGWISGWSS